MKSDVKQKPMVDIIAVSKAAKVSISTVSRSFNHPHLVNPATRKKIDRAVKKLGYIRNRAAQSMHGRRSGTIGLIVPTINHTIFSEVIQSFSNAVEEMGFTILITSHGYDLDREYAVLRKLMEHRVDGIAVTGLEHSEDSYQLIAQQNTPALAIWNYSDAAPIACVGVDNTAAGRMAAEHLVSLGHRDIALIFPQTHGNDRAHDRLIGAMSCLQKHGITVPDNRRIEVPYSISQAKAACGQLLAQPNRPTAILCGNDVIAHGALYAAQKAGVAVPGALSLIGIGDFQGSEDMEPALTTIAIPAQHIGDVAGKQLARMIMDQISGPLRHKCDLACIVRETTARPWGA
ncbi:MAG: LacI family DNA-binding transcriptional regulator [Sulfitobacter sp.]